MNANETSIPQTKRRRYATLRDSRLSERLRGCDYVVKILTTISGVKVSA